MTSLKLALETTRPELHDALRKSARKAYLIKESECAYALRTVAGSAARWKRVGDSSWLTVSRDDSSDGDVAVRCNVPLWASKLGGYGLVPRGVDYPKGSDGQPLQLVAQVNFGELWADAAARDGDFEVPALLPSRGVLAFYADGFDDEYGIDYGDKSTQKNFRILYLDHELRPLEALLEEYRGGAITSKVLESRVGELLWTREEQYDLFETYLIKKDPSYMPYNSAAEWSNAVSRDAQIVSNPQWIQFLRSLTYLPGGCDQNGGRLGRVERPETPAQENGTSDILPDHISPHGRETRPCLWYGVADLYQEFPIFFDGVEEMVPVEAVEFTNHVLVDCFTQHPELADEYIKDENCYLSKLDDFVSPVGFQYFMPSEPDADGKSTFSGIDRQVDRPYHVWNYFGGYPVFAQEDIRERLNLSEVFDTVEQDGKTVLVRRSNADEVLAAHYAKEEPCFLELNEKSHRIQWKDVGSCNLFIKKDDLASEQWTRLSYNWDCV
ncbi:Domain of unknown function (DUF1963), putative [Angomonas deanei]|uniref:Uncharacterized protein n=1 Tax=Angomonas deanei TaxID=59799 RepID=A0A7G2CE95_9TRYP|nr:Domain of unknown function (DUF1963), putative [Angomonas deanei]